MGGENDPYLKIWNSFNYSFEIIEKQLLRINQDCVIAINEDYYIFGGNHTYLYLFILLGKKILGMAYIDKIYINSLLLLNNGNLLFNSVKNIIKFVGLENLKVKDAIKINSKSKINWHLAIES